MMVTIGDIISLESSILSKKGFGLVLGEDTRELLIAPVLGEKNLNRSKTDSISITREDLECAEIERMGFVHAHRTVWIEKKPYKILGKATSKFVDKVLRFQAATMARNYYVFAHRPKQNLFVPGASPVPVAGRFYGSEEIENLIESALDFWLTTGRFNDAFQQKFASYLNLKHILTTNSGSSANLLAISALTSSKLKAKKLRPGDEIITVAAGFPTTVNPIIQNGLVPVFVDVDIPSYNVKSELIEGAFSEKTRAIMLAHTLGNPFDVNEVLRVAKKYDCWVIEDCCDALGAKYFLDSSLVTPDLAPSRLVGTFGDIATFSFYPAHHITMGEGGAVATANDLLKRLVESFRDWGRDCWCPPGHDNTCRKRFGWQLGDLPKGYDHKYIYSHLGYNLRITDMQAAVGLAQIEKLQSFIEDRGKNWQFYYEKLKEFEEYFYLPKPSSNSKPSWFGFALTVRKNAPFSRNEIVEYLEKNNIATRMLFSGNIIRHPSFENVTYRIHGNLENTDFIMNNSFWLGVYPGISESMLDYVVSKIDTFLQGKTRK